MLFNSRGLLILVFDEKSNELYEYVGWWLVCVLMMCMLIIVIVIVLFMININEGLKDVCVMFRNFDILVGDIISFIVSFRLNVNLVVLLMMMLIVCCFVVFGFFFLLLFFVLIVCVM